MEKPSYAVIEAEMKKFAILAECFDDFYGAICILNPYYANGHTLGEWEILFSSWRNEVRKKYVAARPPRSIQFPPASGWKILGIDWGKNKNE